jgi:hypothetical protein
MSDFLIEFNGELSLFQVHYFNCGMYKPRTDNGDQPGPCIKVEEGKFSKQIGKETSILPNFQDVLSLHFQEVCQGSPNVWQFRKGGLRVLP